MKHIFLITPLLLYIPHFLLTMEPEQLYSEETDIRTNNGNLPIHEAILHKSKKDIKLFLCKKKTNINGQNYEGDTALHIACEKGFLDIFKLLLDNGADVTIKNNNHITPLFFLFMLNLIPTFITNEPDIARLCIQTMDDQNNTQIHLCAMLQPIEPSLFKRINSHVNYELLPSPFEKYISFLIAQGLDIHAKNKNGKRAIDLVYKEYHSLCAQYRKNPLPYIEEALNHQEVIMHSFLRSASYPKKCALLESALNTETDHTFLPKNIITIIMQNYYQLNIETIVAKEYTIQCNYRNKSIAEKNKIKKHLQDNPKHLELLWYKPITKPMLVD